MAANETDPKAMKALEELKAEFAKAIDAIDKRIVALGERVVSIEESHNGERVANLSTAVARLENAPREAVSFFDDLRPLFETVDALHRQVMGVPAGSLQSLKD